VTFKASKLSSYFTFRGGLVVFGVVKGLKGRGAVVVLRDKSESEDGNDKTR
jgi:hypothetical protein